MGGEEFIVMLPGCHGKDAVKIMEGFQAMLNNANIEHQYSLVGDRLSASIGIAYTCPHQTNGNYKQVLEKADEVLYSAKGAGRNRILAVDVTNEPERCPQKQSSESKGRFVEC